MKYTIKKKILNPKRCISLYITACPIYPLYCINL